MVSDEAGVHNWPYTGSVYVLLGQASPCTRQHTNPFAKDKHQITGKLTRNPDATINRESSGPVNDAEAVAIQAKTRCVAAAPTAGAAAAIQNTREPPRDFNAAVTAIDAKATAKNSSATHDCQVGSGEAAANTAATAAVASSSRRSEN